MNNSIVEIRQCVKRVLRETAVLAAEKRCKQKKDDELSLSHGTLSRV